MGIHEPAPSVVVADLVEKFREQADDYRSGQYNETQTRREFIDPLFEALGWDVTNRAGYAESYKDVVHEDAVRVGRTGRKPETPKPEIAAPPLAQLSRSPILVRL